MTCKWFGFRLGLSAGLLGLLTAQPRPLWLTVAGTSKTLTPVLKITRQLRPFSTQAGVVASSDCENLEQGLFLSVAAIATDRAGAQEVLAKVKTVSTAAYVRECRPKNGSRISLGIPAIDPSIEAVPPNTVNWTDEDRVSTIIKLPEDGFLWIRKMYQPAPEDPREGRRTSVQFFRTDPHKSIQLSADCTDLSVSQRAGRIALSCARETAAENLLHETSVYDENSGKELMIVARCRNPEFISRSELRCGNEEVDRSGTLHLHAKRVALQ